MWNMLKMKIRYSVRYWYKKLCYAFGFCPVCGCAVNRTRNGRPICPNCGK